jgi:hypothetical protein
MEVIMLLVPYWIMLIGPGRGVKIVPAAATVFAAPVVIPPPFRVELRVNTVLLATEAT